MDGGDRRFHNDIVIMNQIMLKFRPIAPKPVANGSGYSDLEKKSKEIMSKKRTKRKYVRVCKNLKSSVAKTKTNNKKKADEDWFDETVATLQLLPEIGKFSSETVIDYSVVQNLPGLFTGNSNCSVSDLRVVEAYVTLECVTGCHGYAYGDGLKWLGSTDMDKMSNLEKDTCPGFVSDGDGAVRWLNLAFKRMISPAAEENGEVAEAMVWLIGQERIPVVAEVFSCRVRVAYGGRGKVVPCDVWRMDQVGRYAWRLDVDAALSLGR